MAAANHDYTGLPRGLFGLMRRWLMRWVKTRLIPEDLAQQSDELKGPVVYVLDEGSLSNRLILDHVCRSLGVEPPSDPAVDRHHEMPPAIFLDRELQARSNKRNSKRVSPLDRLLRAAEQDPEFNAQLVPVSVFLGRAPDRESGWFRVLFTETWMVVGRLRRLLSIVLNGRGTLVQFSAPLPLRSLLEEGVDTQRSARKLGRILRVHFRRVRASVIGPDLSHRRTLVYRILGQPAVRAAIESHATKHKLPLEKARQQARKYLWEIAADYSDPVVRSLSFVLRGFWNRIYDGVEVHHFDALQRIAPGHVVVYVPCHRSHIDYLLLSYILYQRGLVIPHIAAGVNLNLPLVGTLLRGGGAFFLRRSFKNNALYSTVFNEYVSSLISQGVALEYFIEGGRSRTGRLMQPRGGMLAMTVRATLRQVAQPVVFQPVYVGYERLVEGRSYLSELSGKAKRSESLLGLVRSLRMLRSRYGKVVVNFGEPIFLDELISKHRPPSTAEVPAPAVPVAALVDDLARRVMTNINRAADANPINLLSMALLSTPRQCMDIDDLKGQLDLYQAVLRERPYAPRVTCTEMSAEQIIEHGLKLRMIERIKHPLGDLVRLEQRLAVMQTYFRNNVLHLFVAASWVACCFLNQRDFARREILRRGRLVYPFLQSELFLHFDQGDWLKHTDATVELFLRRRLLTLSEDGQTLSRAPGGTAQSFQLKTFAHGLLQSFQRYYITVAVLVRRGPGVLSSAELENLCHLTAQRLSLLFEFNAPEFFDKSLFRNFIAGLRERKLLWTDEGGKLHYSEALVHVVEDAKVILGKDVRHGVLLAGPEELSLPAPTAKPEDENAAG